MTGVFIIYKKWFIYDIISYCSSVSWIIIWCFKADIPLYIHLYIYCYISSQYCRKFKAETNGRYITRVASRLSIWPIGFRRDKYIWTRCFPINLNSIIQTCTPSSWSRLTIKENIIISIHDICLSKLYHSIDLSIIYSCRIHASSRNKVWIICCSSIGTISY